MNTITTQRLDLQTTLLVFSWIAAVLAVVWIAGGALVFSRTKPFYSHIRQTISELGERGFSVAGNVAWLGFFPAGIFIWLFCAAVWFAVPIEDIREAVMLYGLYGLAYIGAALFPCDAGAPLIGSWRNNLHNAFAIAGYLGGAGALYILEGAYSVSQPAMATAFRSLAFAVIAGLILMGQGWLARWRGLIQRLLEAALLAAMPLLLIALAR